MVTVIGIDIGQKRDPTAICVVESEERELEHRRHSEAHFLVRFLERMPLGTPYPQIADRLQTIVTQVADWIDGQPQVYVDATGVGQPIVDLLEQEIPEATIRAVYFTHGDRRTVEGSSVKLGKAYLVSRLQALLQTGCLHLPRTSEAEALAAELLDYEIRVDQNANDRYGAFRVGAHDDLVTALGLAVQVDPRTTHYFIV